MSAGRPVGVSRLAELIWPEQLPKRVRPSVQTLVARVRAVVPDVIVTAADGYQLNIDPDRVDLLLFRRLARAANDAADSATAAGLLDQALALWRDEPLSDLQSSAIQRDVVPALVEERLLAVQQRVELDLAAGRHSWIVAELQALIGRYPLREPLWGQLIRALAASGRPAEAIQQYYRARAILAEELGVDPSTDLQDLYRRLLQAGQQAVITAETPDQAAAERSPVRAEGMLAVPRRPDGGGAGDVPGRLLADTRVLTGRRARAGRLLDRAGEADGARGPGPAASSVAGMLQIEFTADDVARTRFLPEPAPLMELKLALVALSRGDKAARFDQWRRVALAAFPESAQLVWQLVSCFSGRVSPTAALGADIDEELDMVVAMRPEQARAEIDLWYGTDSGRVPPLLRDAANGSRQAEQLMIQAFRSAYAAVLEPSWPAVQASYHAELARQSLILARSGVGGLLTNLLPGAHWQDGRLRIPAPYRRRAVLRGRGLVLAPSAFWMGPPLLADVPDQPVLLVYPSGTPAPLLPGAGSDPLAGILGSTRAAVLRLLTVPHTTSDVARGLGISLASASGHTACLREAQLITSHRDGKAVLHQATELGLSLITTGIWP